MMRAICGLTLVGVLLLSACEEPKAKVVIAAPNICEKCAAGDYQPCACCVKCNEKDLCCCRHIDRCPCNDNPSRAGK